MDSNIQSSNNSMSAETFIDMMDKRILCDVWRSHHPDEKKYSWYRDNPHQNQHTSNVYQASRIDYAIISRGMCDKAHNTFYMNGLKTDHSAFFLEISPTESTRGRGYWKMTTSVLSDITFVCAIGESLRKNQNLSYPDRWELLKLDIKKCAEQHCRRKASEEKLTIS